MEWRESLASHCEVACSCRHHPQLRTGNVLVPVSALLVGAVVVVAVAVSILVAQVHPLDAMWMTHSIQPDTAVHVVGVGGLVAVGALLVSAPVLATALAQLLVVHEAVHVM